MNRDLCLLFAIYIGCAHAPLAETEFKRCQIREELSRRFVGQRLTDKLERSIREAAGPGPFQVLRPDTPAPNNKIDNRLTVQVDGLGVVRRIGCEEPE
jgi:hypothetical protein